MSADGCTLFPSVPELEDMVLQTHSPQGGLLFNLLSPDCFEFFTPALADLGGDLKKQMKHVWTQKIMRSWPEGESSKDQEERMVFSAMCELPFHTNLIWLAYIFKGKERDTLMKAFLFLD